MNNVNKPNVRLRAALLLSATAPLLLSAAGLVAAGCGNKKKNDQEVADEKSGVAPKSPSGAAPGPDQAQSSTSDGFNLELARITPEQVQRVLKSALGVELADKNADYLMGYFAVPLGGILPEARVRRREPRPRPQTLLAVRAIAWISALKLIDQEFNQPNKRSVFSAAAFDFQTMLDSEILPIHKETLELMEQGSESQNSER